MKKSKRNSFVWVTVLTAFCACSPGKQENTPAESAPPAVETEMPKGLQLIQSNDCQTCHHINNKLMGPSYNAIASRYEVSQETRRQLTSKIINGGAGVWGDIPMNAHPVLPEADAIEMVNYILSLKK